MPVAAVRARAAGLAALAGSVAAHRAAGRAAAPGPPGAPAAGAAVAAPGATLGHPAPTRARLRLLIGLSRGARRARGARAQRHPASPRAAGRAGPRLGSRALPAFATWNRPRIGRAGRTGPHPRARAGVRPHPVDARLLLHPALGASDRPGRRAGGALAGRRRVACTPHAVGALLDPRPACIRAGPTCARSDRRIRIIAVLIGRHAVAIGVEHARNTRAVHARLAGGAGRVAAERLRRVPGACIQRARRVEAAAPIEAAGIPSAVVHTVSAGSAAGGDQESRGEDEEEEEPESHGTESGTSARPTARCEVGRRVVIHGLREEWPSGRRQRF